jgi:hypothetical protein
MIAVIVEAVMGLDDLAQSAIAALLAAFGVTLAFSLAVFGATRYADLRRDGRDVAALGAAALAVVALLTALAVVVVGLVIVAD